MGSTTTQRPLPENGVLDLFRLDGRTALVTGASSGLGAGFALALAEAGAQVVLTARRADRLRETAERIEALGGECLVVATDVTDPEQCEKAVAAAVARFGKLDILINNAGVSSAVPALRERPEDFRQVLDVNLMGAYWMAQSCARVMGPGSSIVNVASVLGLIKSVLPQAAYAASKAGLIGLTRDLSQQWAGRRGIRVNAVAPGFVATEMIAEMPSETLDEFLRATSPLARTGTQRELDAAVVFLAAPASSYITGTTLAVDGGMSGH
ncbi:SDR family NAD(P)-dependent oxidoreductase [Streptomyces sp. NPDC058442]|uniref:SDR family NAD(P)-dependent oxidoreductase n=1 Tax=Streptomyces sp. NPDC058442 TaxID=3346503 RepID=UPI003655E40F